MAGGEAAPMQGNRELILVVEDDPAVQAALRRRLRFEGYRVETAERGDAALERLSALKPDLVLLDVMLPGMDGLEVAERMRALGRIPILMLTARRELADKVAGLESGADDYLVKPFAIEELLARIRALLRRAQPAPEAQSEAPLLQYADLTMDLATREVFRGQRPVSLTAREQAILEHFLRHPRQVLTREQIYEAGWKSEYLSESNIVDVNIKALRDKLDAGGEARLIQTLRGVGYSLRTEA
jgi:two-component system response regulator MprA